MQTRIHKYSGTIKKILGDKIFGYFRRAATAFLTPYSFSKKTGHFKSSFRASAVNKYGEAIPWYTYGAFDFLRYRDFSDKSVLEFGGGQSTIWWGIKAKTVLSFEGNKEWFQYVKSKLNPQNTNMFYVSTNSVKEFNTQVMDKIKPEEKFDIVIVDGLLRNEALEIASNVLAKDGFIIVDNAEGWSFYDQMKNSKLINRIDFYGFAPGVYLPHCTSIFYRENTFLTKNLGNEIKQIARE